MHRFSIGRDQNCDVVLHGATVSRQHAYLTLRGDGSIQFEDANSTNGSYLVEGDKLVPLALTGREDVVLHNRYAARKMMLISQPFKDAL